MLTLFVVMFLHMDRNYNDLLNINNSLSEQNKLLQDNYTQLRSKMNVKEKEYTTNLKEVEERCVEFQNETSKTKRYYEKLISEDTERKYSKEEIYMLAQCVQAEAGHYKNHSKAQKMITSVILHRVDSVDFPDTIKDVIYQKNGGSSQFSVAYNGAMQKQKVTPETLSNVYEVLLFGYDIPFDVQYFYAESLKESNWVKNLEVYATVEGTVFAYNKRR